MTHLSFFFFVEIPSAHVHDAVPWASFVDPRDYSVSSKFILVIRKTAMENCFLPSLPSA